MMTILSYLLTVVGTLLLIWFGTKFFEFMMEKKLHVVWVVVLMFGFVTVGSFIVVDVSTWVTGIVPSIT